MRTCRLRTVLCDVIAFTQVATARLLKQIEENEARELKLMAEKVKCDQQHSLVCEEKRLLQERQTLLQSEVDKQV